jgi:two-component system, NarL family, sensor histidine kinase UhpB
MQDRRSSRSLFFRVFAVNAAVLVVAAVVLAASPLTISTSLALSEALGLIVGVLLTLGANLLLLRPYFVPLERLADRMRRVDLLRPGQRMAISGHGEVAELVRSFNEMLDRLERERRDSGSRALAAAESVRLRIARGLHDEVGQTMTGVLLQLKRLEQVVGEDARAELEEAQHAVRTALEEVRRIAQELRPQTLEHLGLVSALTTLATTFSQRTGLEVERRFAHSLPELDPDAEVAVYRVAQESLTNVARHADAGHVRVSLEPGRGSVVLRVVDDGKGFDGGLPAEGGGLRGMRERAVLVGAELSVRARPEGGTEVRLEVPLAAVPA